MVLGRKVDNKTTIHTASLSVRSRKKKNKVWESSFLALRMLTKSHIWLLRHRNMEHGVTVIGNSVPRSRSLAQLVWFLSNLKFKDGEFPSESQTHGQRHNLCFLPSSTEHPFRSELEKTHEPWKLDQSPHDTISKAPTD